MSPGRSIMKRIVDSPAITSRAASCSASGWCGEIHSPDATGTARTTPPSATTVPIENARAPGTSVTRYNSIRLATGDRPRTLLVFDTELDVLAGVDSLCVMPFGRHCAVSMMSRAR
jgi:hypothetical protein